LCLIIDFKLSHRDQFQTKEGSTGSMPAMVHMREYSIAEKLRNALTLPTTEYDGG
jgi:hypothetical protein